MSPDSEEAPRPPEAFRRLLQDGARRFELSLPDPVLDLLAAYLSELDVWRRKVNLTGRLSPAELGVHALESVLGARLIAHGARVVDIGSGRRISGASARDREGRPRRHARRAPYQTLRLPAACRSCARTEERPGSSRLASKRSAGRPSMWRRRGPSGASRTGWPAHPSWTLPASCWPGPPTRPVSRPRSVRSSALTGPLPISGSEKRRIVAFRRIQRNVPRGTLPISPSDFGRDRR